MDEKVFASTAAGSLRALRARRGISQRELSEDTGFSKSTIGLWEKDAGLSLKHAWALADYYGCSLDELAGRDRR